MPRKLSSTNNKTKEWERVRRERLNDCFNHLGLLLPDYDPSVVTSKADILQKAAKYIRDLQQENRNLLNGGLDESSLTQLTVLKLRVEELVKRTQQLATLLRDAGITIPSESAQVPIGQRTNHWSNKIKPQDAEALLAKVQEKQAADKIKKSTLRKKKSERVKTAKIVSPPPSKKKPLNSTVLSTSNIPSKVSKRSKKPKRTKIKKNTCENLSVPLMSAVNSIPQNQANIMNTQIPQSYIVINNSSSTSVVKTSPCFVMSNNDAKSSISLMMNQNLAKPQLLTAPIMATRIQTCQTASVMNHNTSLANLVSGTLILANGSILPVLPQPQTVLTPLLVNSGCVAPRTQPLFVMRNAVVNDQLTTTTVASSRPQRLFPKRPVRKDITKTTYANKVPIPSLASMQYLVEKSLEQVVDKTPSPPKINKKNAKKKVKTAIVESVSKSAEPADGKKVVTFEKSVELSSKSAECTVKTVVLPLDSEEQIIQDSNKDSTVESINIPDVEIRQSDVSILVPSTINKCDTQLKVNLGKREADSDISISSNGKQMKLDENVSNKVLDSVVVSDTDSTPKVFISNKPSCDVPKTVLSSISKTSNSGSYTIDALCKLKSDKSCEVGKDVELETVAVEKTVAKSPTSSTVLLQEDSIIKSTAMTISRDLIVAEKVSVSIPPVIQNEKEMDILSCAVSSSGVSSGFKPLSNVDCLVSREKSNWCPSMLPTYTQAKVTSSQHTDSTKPSTQQAPTYTQNKVPTSFSNDNMFFKSSSSVNYVPPVSSTNIFTSISHFENNSFVPIQNDSDAANVHSSLSLAIQNHEFSNDIFASLQVPSGGQHPESISPTAAFLLAFPLVSTSKVTEMIDAGEEAGSDSLQGTATLLQIGNIDSDQGNIISCVPRSLSISKEVCANRFTEGVKSTESEKVLPTSRSDECVFSEFSINASKKISSTKQNIFEYDNYYSGIIPPVSAPDSFVPAVTSFPTYDTKSTPNQFDSSKATYTNLDAQMPVTDFTSNKFLNLPYSQNSNIGLTLPAASSSSMPTYAPMQKTPQYDLLNRDVPKSIPEFIPNKFMNFGVTSSSTTVLPVQKSTQTKVANFDVPKSVPDFSSNKFYSVPYSQKTNISSNSITVGSTQTKTDSIASNVSNQKLIEFSPSKFLNSSYSRTSTVGLTSCSNSVPPVQKITGTSQNNPMVHCSDAQKSKVDYTGHKISNLSYAQSSVMDIACNTSFGPQPQTSTGHNVPNLEVPKSKPDFTRNNALSLSYSQTASVPPCTGIYTQTSDLQNVSAAKSMTQLGQSVPNKFLNLTYSQISNIPSYSNTLPPTKQSATQIHALGTDAQTFYPDFTPNKFTSNAQTSTIATCSIAVMPTQTVTTPKNVANIDIQKSVPGFTPHKFTSYSQVSAGPSAVTMTHTVAVHNSAPSNMDGQKPIPDFTPNKFMSYSPMTAVGTCSNVLTQTRPMQNTAPDLDIPKAIPDFTQNKFLHSSYSQASDIGVSSNSSTVASKQTVTMQSSAPKIGVQKPVSDFTANKFLNLPYLQTPSIAVSSSSVLPAQKIATHNPNLPSKENVFLGHSTDSITKANQQRNKFNLPEPVQVQRHTNCKPNSETSKYSIANISNNFSETKAPLYNQSANLNSEPYNYNLFNSSNPVITSSTYNYSQSANDKAYVSHNSSTILPWTSYSTTATSNTNQFDSFNTTPQVSQQSGPTLQVNNALPGIHEIYGHKSANEQLVQKPDSFGNIFARSNDNVQFQSTQNPIQDTQNYKYQTEIKTQASVNPVFDKSQNHNQRPPVNWMTTPDSRQQIFTSAPNQTATVNSITTTAVITEPPQKPFEMCPNQNVIPANSAPSTNYDSRHLNTAPFYGNNLYPSNSTNHFQEPNHEPQQRSTETEPNELYPFNWNQSPRKNPFSSSSALPDINNGVFVPSTLPTLVGDLALGTNFTMNIDEHNKTFLQSYDVDKTSEEQRQDKSQKPNEKESKTRKSNEYQSGSHILSVSQLVDQAKSAVGLRSQGMRRNNRNVLNKSTSQRQPTKRGAAIEETRKALNQEGGINYQPGRDTRGLFNPETATPSYQTFRENQINWMNANIPKQTRTQYKAPVSSYSAEALIGPTNNQTEVNKSRDIPKVVTLPPPMVSERFSHETYNQRVPSFAPDILQPNYFSSVEPLPHQDLQMSNTSFQNQNYSQPNFHSTSANTSKTTVTSSQNLYPTTFQSTNTNFLMDISSNNYPSSVLTPDHNYIFPPSSLPPKNSANRAPRPNLTYSAAANLPQCPTSGSNSTRFINHPRRMPGANASQQNCLKQKVRRRIPEPIVSTTISTSVPDIGYVPMPPGMNHPGMIPTDEYSGYSQHNPIIYSTTLNPTRSANLTQRNQVATSVQQRTAQQATASPSATNASNTLTNFNLSTIFPEINDKQAPPPSNFNNTGQQKNAMPPPSSLLPPPGQIGPPSIPPADTFGHSAPQVCRMQWS